jgi:hypothetical protein
MHPNTPREVIDTMWVLADAVRNLHYRLNHAECHDHFNHFYYSYAFKAHGEIQHEFVEASTDAGAEKLAKARCARNGNEFVSMTKVYRT